MGHTPRWLRKHRQMMSDPNRHTAQANLEVYKREIKRWSEWGRSA